MNKGWVLENAELNKNASFAIYQKRNSILRIN